MLKFFFLSMLCSCGILDDNVIKDIIQSEENVAEKVIGDIAEARSTPQNPPH